MILSPEIANSLGVVLSRSFPYRLRSDTVRTATLHHVSQEPARYSSQPAGFLPRHHCIRAVNFARDQGSSIHDVLGSGNLPATSTVSHPSRVAMDRSLPLRAIQRRAPRASQAVIESTARCHTSCPLFPSVNGLGTAPRKPPRSCRRSLRSPAREYRGTVLPEPSGFLPKPSTTCYWALTATGQVVMLKVDGRTVYRAAG